MTRIYLYLCKKCGRSLKIDSNGIPVTCLCTPEEALPQAKCTNIEVWANTKARVATVEDLDRTRKYAQKLHEVFPQQPRSNNV